MKNPKLIVKPFAKNGQKNVIPENYETSMDSNQATWDQGFGQITMLPVAAGGLPPKGQDFNGILNQISENIVYQSQGGRFKFSPEYAESIGGYPKGAILQSDDEKKEYQSLIDNNKVNFNTTSNISASWELVGYKYAIKTEVDLALTKKFDKENISSILGNDNSKVPSLGLLTTEVGKLQPKGNYQPVGDYATNTALTSGLAGKQPVGDYATNNALVNGLGQKLNTSSVVQSTGSSTMQVMSQKAVTDLAETKQPAGNYALQSSTNQFKSGNHKIDSGSDYSSVELYTSNGSRLSIETIPTGTSNSGNVIFRTPEGSLTSVLKIPNKRDDTIACLGDVLAVGQDIVDMTSQRFVNEVYTNNTGKPIMVYIHLNQSISKNKSTFISKDGVNWVAVSNSSNAAGVTSSFVVPAGWKYKAESVGTWWSEMR